MQNTSIGEFEELVLLTVAVQHDTAYGVSIINSLESKMEKKINVSAVHVALKRMEEKGFVESRYGGVTSDRGGRRKKYYTITAFGKKVIDQQYTLRAGLYLSIPKISYS